jgi:hypothetical protein
LATLADASSAAAIVSFMPPSGGGTAAIAGDGQSVSYTAPRLSTPPLCEPAETMVYQVPYVVRSVSGGGSASGTATISVRGPAGPRPRPGQYCP